MYWYPCDSDTVVKVRVIAWNCRGVMRRVRFALGVLGGVEACLPLAATEAKEIAEDWVDSSVVLFLFTMAEAYFEASVPCVELDVGAKTGNSTEVVDCFSSSWILMLAEFNSARKCWFSATRCSNGDRRSSYWRNLSKIVETQLGGGACVSSACGCADSTEREKFSVLFTVACVAT